MAGAFGSSLGRRRRRRFAEGGALDGDVPDSDAISPRAASDASNPDTYNPPSASPPAPMSGAPTVGLSPDQQIGAAQRGMANLQNQNAVDTIFRAAGMPLLDPSEREGAINLPMLAAAGAMLRPTHSGTFSEALGNAMEAAVQPTEKQREMNLNAQMRKAQLDTNAAIWSGRLGIQQQRADTYADVSGSRAEYYQAQADKLTAGGGPNGEKFKYIGDDPGTGKPILQGDRGTMRLGDIQVGLTANQQSQADSRNTRSNLSQQSLDLRKQALAALIQQRGIQNDRAAQNALAAEIGKMTDEQIRYVTGTRDVMGKPTVSPEKAGTTVQQMREHNAGTLKQLALPMPATAADAIVGKVYNTARGRAVWNGDQFIPEGQ